jgi:hypothetical protein
MDTKGARQHGGYHKRENDYITVKECVILIHHSVAKAMAAERQAVQDRTLVGRFRAWRRLQNHHDLTLGVG